MATQISKIDTGKNVYYVLRDGKKPDIYLSYNEALKQKYDWDERQVIRKFDCWCRAFYYFETGKDIPPPPIDKAPRGRALF